MSSRPTEFLRNSALAWELRRSAPWRYYQRVVHRNIIEDGRAFYAALLQDDARGAILDIGANVGSKTELFRGFTDLVVAVEPDPDMATLLRKRFYLKRDVSVLQCALSDYSGSADLHKFPGNEAYNTMSDSWAKTMVAKDETRTRPGLPPSSKIAVSVQTLAAVEQRYRPVKYIKIDAEGLEFEIISTLARPVGLISLEFNLPQFEQSLLQTLDKLEGLDSGYRFNVAITEPPRRLEFDEWLGKTETLARIKSAGWGYVELYARLVP